MSATEWGSGTMFLTFPRGLKRMLWTALWMLMSMEPRQIPALTAIVI